MIDKYSKLINFLMQQHEFVIAKVISDNLGLSPRTIKNYIKNINGDVDNLIISSNKGYLLNKSKLDEFNSLINNNLPTNSKDRQSYILNKLVKNKAPINIYDLSDEIYISSSLLYLELNKIKKKICKYNLSLIIKKDLVSLAGLEKNKRKLVSYLLYNESNINFITLDSIQNYFINLDINYIKNLVLNVFNQHNYFINDYSLLNFVLHVAITIDRIKNSNIICAYIEKIFEPNDLENTILDELISKLESKFNINFMENERYELFLLIISRSTTMDYTKLNISTVNKVIPKENALLIFKLLDTLNSYCINLNEEEFLTRFSIHVNNLIIRSKNNYYSKNPLKSMIKTTCPLIYEIALSLSNIILKEKNIRINDDEIAYIAIHIGSALETQKNYKERIKVALINPSYYDTSQKIFKTISSDFENEILITDLFSNVDKITKPENIDLIISTIPLYSNINIPTLLISPFITTTDKEIILNKVVKIKKEKKKYIFEKYLKQLIREELFYKNCPINSKNEIIDFLCTKLKDLNFVKDNFFDEVIEREKLSSTAFNNFAIPHALEMNANKTAIAITIPSSPIIWEEHRVELVLMMCFNQNDRDVFNEIFEPLSMILSNISVIKELASSNTYNDFIDIILNSYSAII